MNGLTCLCSLLSLGYLLLSTPLDRESLDRYTLEVTASDGHQDGVRKELNHTGFNWLTLSHSASPAGIEWLLKARRSEMQRTPAAA